MAKINPIKTRQDAEKAEKAGKLEQAIPLYRLLVEDNPRDWNTINKIGDLFAKIGKMREAGDEYAKVAEFYAKDGFHLKAIAIWKKINKLDPAAMQPYAELADLYAKQGLVMEAKGQYQVVSEDQLKRGRLKEAAETLRKMVEIDPADLKTRSRLADIYTREGATDRAVNEYIAIAAELNLKGHPAEGIQVLEKGLKIDTGITVRKQLGRVHLAQRSYDKAIAYLEEVSAQQSDIESLVQLGQAYLGAKRVTDAQATLENVLEKSPQSQEARIILVQIYAALGRFDEAYDGVIPLVEQFLLKRDTDRAASLLNQITLRAPHHVRTLQKLVEVARIRQNERAIVQALSQLLEAHIVAGSDRAAEDTASQMVEVEPDNEQFKARLESLRKKKAGPAISGPAKVVGTRAASPDATLPPPTMAAGTSDLDGLQFDTGAVVRPKGISADSNTDREFIEEHLAESRVFRKYGLLDKAEEQVDLVLVRYPNIFDGRFEKKEIFKETERMEAAAKECLWLAEVARKDSNQSLAQMLGDEAETLWPGISQTAASAPVVDAPVDDASIGDAPLGDGEMGEASLGDGSLGADSLTEESFGTGEISLDSLSAPGTPDLEPLPDLPSESPAFDAAAFAEEAPLMGESAPGVEGFSDVGSPGQPAAPGHDDEEDLNLNLHLDEAGESSASAAPQAGGLAFDPDLPMEGLGLEDGEMSVSQAEDAQAMAAGFGDLPEDLAPASTELPSFPDQSEDHGPDLEFASAAADRAAAPTAPAIDPEVERAVEEVDSYMALGFVDDAKDALRDALNRFPGDPSLMERASSLGLDLSARPDPPPPLAQPTPEPPPASAAKGDDLLGGFSFDDLAPPPSEPEVTPPSVNARVSEAGPVGDFGGIDLGAELSSLFDAQPALEDAPIDTSRSSSFEDQGLQDVFDAFKKGVDSQLAEGDYDTRYNLGIAYKEMGLIDEAIAEFQLAAKDPKRSLECSSMIGICFMEKGMADVAVQWYQRGLQVQGRAPEEYQGLRYDLGLAWEASGDLDKATATFGDLVREDPSFRDVSSKLRELQSRA